MFKCFFVYLDDTSTVVSDLCAVFPPAQPSFGLLLVSAGSLWFTCCLSHFNVFHLFDNSPETHSKTAQTPNKTWVSRKAWKSLSRYQRYHFYGWTLRFLCRCEMLFTVHLTSTCHLLHFQMNQYWLILFLVNIICPCSQGYVNRKVISEVLKVAFSWNI